MASQQINKKTYILPFKLKKNYSSIILSVHIYYNIIEYPFLSKNVTFVWIFILFFSVSYTLKHSRIKYKNSFVNFTIVFFLFNDKRLIFLLYFKSNSHYHCFVQCISSVCWWFCSHCTIEHFNNTFLTRYKQRRKSQ